MIGAAAQLADGRQEDAAPGLVRLGGDGADAGQDQGSPQLVGQGERLLGPVEAVVELIHRVERPSRRQVQRDQVQFHRAEGVPQLATTRLGEPVGGEVSHRIDDDPLAPSRAAARICSLIGREGSSRSPRGERIMSGLSLEDRRTWRVSRRDRLRF